MNTLQMSLRELLRRRQNFVLNTLLVLCVTGALAAVWTLRDATMQRVRRVMAQMGNNLLFLPRAASLDAYYTAGPDQATMDQSLADYMYVHPVTGHHGTHYVAKFQRRTRVNGAEVIVTGFRVMAGGHRPGEDKSRRRSFLDDPLPPGQLVFGAEAARSAKVKTGDNVEVEGRPFRVREVNKELGEFDDLRVWGNLDEVQRLWNASGQIHSVDALGCWGDGSYLEPIQKALADDQKLTGLRLLHSDVSARTRIRARTAVETVGFMSGAIVAILAGIGIFAASLMEVRDRRSEIGVLRAMGARRWQVLHLFLPKMLAVSLTGGLLGWLIGTAGAVWVGPRLNLGLEEVKFQVLIELLPICLAVGLVFVLLASGLAIWRAMRLDPVVALREL